MAMLTDEWNADFVERWNRSPPACDSMRGAGMVRFLQVGHDIREAVFYWDEGGRVVLRDLRRGEGMPSFSAGADIWRDFLAGALEAKWAVMTGKIKFKGSISFAIRYGESFNWVARVCKGNQLGD